MLCQIQRIIENQLFVSLLDFHCIAMLTGMRSCEVVIMRPGDIDTTSGDVWVFQPEKHKNLWRGHQKLIHLGPAAQEILRPYLDRPAGSYLFSPKESEAWRNEHEPPYTGYRRKTPVYPSELRRRKALKRSQRGRKTKRPLGDRYDTTGYRRAIKHGFTKARKAGVYIQRWHPHQLRHNRGTEVRRQHGIEAAAVVLGNASLDVVQIYAEQNNNLAVQIAKRTG